MLPRLRELVSQKPLHDCTMAVDQTGVGRVVADLLRSAQLPVWLRSITITGDHAVAVGADGSLHVPKKELVGTLQVLLHSRRLKVAQTLPEARTLEQELLNFQVKITPAANETFGVWREGRHDDLVLALAFAAWQGERAPAASGMQFVITPSPHQRSSTSQVFRV